MAEKKVFSSKLVRTSNVAKELLIIAKEFDISVHELDFNLIKTELYVKETKKDQEDGEFHEATDDERKQLKNPDALANPELSMKQIYDAEIFLDEEPLFPTLKVVIAGNKSLTAVYATIKAESVIEKTENIADDLKSYFNRRKLRTNILIDMWDDEMIAELAKLSAQVEVNDKVEFKEDKRILVSKSLLAKDTKNDEIILHFETKDEEDTGDRVDHKKRGFITSVEENEVLITYIKPQDGEPGRNCRGKFLEVPEPNVSNTPKFDIDPDCIEVKEDDEKIEYIAKKNGYIDMDGSKYYIKEELEVSEISFKSTGNVNAGLNADISIHVKESDSLSDAIGMGVEVEATDVEVEGNVGSNSSVTAQRIKIGGQTHKSSKLMAPKIEVNLHRGFAKGKDIEIKRLEQGHVEGEEIYIEQAAGGEVIGKNVTIEILQSHMKVIASESITIKKMKGSENTLIIDQAQVGENAHASDTLESDIDDKRIEINLAKKSLDESKALFDKHESTMKEIKERLLAYKKAGAKLPDAFVKKYKEFQTLQNKIMAEERDYNLMKEMFETMQASRGSFQSSIMEAKVVNQDLWKGHNEVRFHLSSPKQELVFFPSEDLKKSAIMLKYDKENDEYSVVSQSAEIPSS